MGTIKELFARLGKTFGPSGNGSAEPTQPEKEKTFRLLAEHSPDVIFRFGIDGRAYYISPSAERLFGCPPREMFKRGGNVVGNGFIHPDDKLLIADTVTKHFGGTLSECRLEFRILRIDGTPVWVETNCSTVIDSTTGQPTDIVFTMRDISKRKGEQAQLAALAHTDCLTGLANRRAFDEKLEREWSRTKREGNHLSLLLLDLDHFKQFNDSNGHQVGDDCLRSVAAVMAKMVEGTGGLAARYGGEEFGIILPDLGRSAAKRLATRICKVVEDLGIPHPAKSYLAKCHRQHRRDHSRFDHWRNDQDAAGHAAGCRHCTIPRESSGAQQSGDLPAVDVGASYRAGILTRLMHKGVFARLADVAQAVDLA